MSVFEQFRRTAMVKEAIPFKISGDEAYDRIKAYPHMIAPHKVGFAGRIQPRHRRWDSGDFEPHDYHDEDLYHPKGHVDDDKWHAAYDKYDPVAKDTKEFSHFILHHADNDAMWHEHAPVTDVNLRSTPITAYQPHVVKHHLLAYMDNPHKDTEHQQKVDRRELRGEDTTEANKAIENYPFTHTPGLVKYQGRHICIEGTHRVAERLVSKAHGMKARVYDADKLGFPKNPEGPIPERPRPSWPPHDPNYKPPAPAQHWTHNFGGGGKDSWGTGAFGWGQTEGGVHIPRVPDHSIHGAKGSYDHFGRDAHVGSLDEDHGTWAHLMEHNQAPDSHPADDFLRRHFGH